MKRSLFLALAIAFSMTACGVAEGPRAKLKHTVFNFNEGLRWGRYNEVIPRVDPEAREHFSQMHEGWGEIVRIEHAEVVQSVVDEDVKKATVTVKWTWYRLDRMEVHTTVTLQHWERKEGEWMMIAEEHQSGTPF